ncbi:MAG: bile acid:sodium symporter family protein [Verrucomicrobiales bacterium]
MGITMLQRLSNLFWLWTLIGVVWAWFFPAHYTWFLDARLPLPGTGQTLPLMAAGLGVIMLGMGITLSFADFQAVCRSPRTIALGVLAQFCIMPFLGWSVAHLFRLPDDLKIGMILVSCCPGGVASNVITYLSRANVPLSVLLTMCSTLAAVLLTPRLTGFYGGKIVPVDEWAMIGELCLIVLLPVIGGLLLNQFAGKRLGPARALSPLVSILLIVLIVGGVVGKTRDRILEAGPVLLVAVVTLHVLGFLLGFGAGRLFGYPLADRRTLSIEVGMQNSGLGAQLAKTHFGLTAAAPCAISALVHCLVGSFLAAVWGRRHSGE